MNINYIRVGDYYMPGFLTTLWTTAVSAKKASGKYRWRIGLL